MKTLTPTQRKALRDLRNGRRIRLASGFCPGDIRPSTSQKLINLGLIRAEVQPIFKSRPAEYFGRYAVLTDAGIEFCITNGIFPTPRNDQ